MIALRAIFIAAVVVLTPATATSIEDQHTVREEQPRTGTRIRRDLASWEIPINKRYEDLSPEHQDMIRSAYENLADSDEPPYPVKGMQAFLKQTTKVQQALLQHGAFRAAALVDAKGAVQSIDVIETPSAEMSQLMAMVLFETQFKPGLCAGQPCQMEFPVMIKFAVR